MEYVGVSSEYLRKMPHAESHTCPILCLCQATSPLMSKNWFSIVATCSWKWTQHQVHNQLSLFDTSLTFLSWSAMYLLQRPLLLSYIFIKKQVDNYLSWDVYILVIEGLRERAVLWSSHFSQSIPKDCSLHIHHIHSEAQEPNCKLNCPHLMLNHLRQQLSSVKGDFRASEPESFKSRKSCRVWLNLITHAHMLPWLLSFMFLC